MSEFGSIKDAAKPESIDGLNESLAQFGVASPADTGLANQDAHPSRPDSAAGPLSKNPGTTNPVPHGASPAQTPDGGSLAP